MPFKSKAKARAYRKKYYRDHKEMMKKRNRKDYLKHLDKRRKARKKYRDEHKAISTTKGYYKKVVRWKHTSRGVIPKDKCVNGCKVPWYILVKHHLKNKRTVIFCPNCHALYHQKRQRRGLK